MYRKGTGVKRRSPAFARSLLFGGLWQGAQSGGPSMVWRGILNFPEHERQA